MSDPELNYILIIESMPHGINVVFYINQNKFIRNKQRMFMNFLDVKRNLLRNVEVTEDTIDLNTGKVEITVTINPIEVNSISLHIDSGYGKLYKINEFYISNTRPRYTDISNVKRVSRDPIDCEIVYSTSQCVPTCTPANQPNGTRFKYRVENIKTFPANGGLSCPLDLNDYPNTSETIVEECEQKICNDCYGYWSEYSECDANGMRYRKYTVVNQGEFGGQPCDTVNGDVMEESCESLMLDPNFDLIHNTERMGNIFKVGNNYYGIVHPGRFKFKTTLFGTRNSDGTVDPNNSCIVTARDENNKIAALTFTPSTTGFDISRTEEEIIEENNILESEIVRPLQQFNQYPRIIVSKYNIGQDDHVYNWSGSFDYNNLKQLDHGIYVFLAVGSDGFYVKEPGETDYVLKTTHSVNLRKTQERNTNCLSWGANFAPAPLASNSDKLGAGNVPDSQKRTFGIQKYTSPFTSEKSTFYNTTCSLYNDVYVGEDWFTKIKWDGN
jgi:hypothetical protein